jgi:hypothetical protein
VGDTSIPTGASVSVSANGTNAAKNVTATFTRAGTYQLYVLIDDPSGNGVTSPVTVTVNQTLTSISVTPAPVELSDNATQQFAATALDQFGIAMASQPTFTWSNSGVGSVNSSGLYSAPASDGTATVTATSASVSGNASVTVGGPAVATAASASTSDGVDIDLSVLGSDPNGESTLTYTWAATSTPSGATVSIGDNADNTAKSTTAAVGGLGTYTFQVTISDGTNSVTSTASVTVTQLTTSIVATPGGAPLTNGSSVQFAATAYDQFGNEMATQPAFTWTAQSGSIESDGTYTAPSSGSGADKITVSGGGTSAGADVEYGTYVGRVYDASDETVGVAGMAIYLSGTTTPGEPATTTDLEGDYALPATSPSDGFCQFLNAAGDATWAAAGPSAIDVGQPQEVDFALMAATSQILTSTGPLQFKVVHPINA